jgi:UrcA family protein
MIKQTLALTLFGLIAFSGATASAQSTSDVTAIRVSYEDLDLQNEKGARILLKRIEGAAAGICRSQVSSRMDNVRWFRPCVREVMTRTVAQVNSPVLQALYENRAPLNLAQQGPAN